MSSSSKDILVNNTNFIRLVKVFLPGLSASSDGKWGSNAREPLFHTKGE